MIPKLIRDISCDMLFASKVTFTLTGWLYENESLVIFSILEGGSTGINLFDRNLYS